MFQKLAQDKIFEKEPVKEMKVSVKGTGFKLLSANFSKRQISLFVDKLKTRKDGVNYILPKDQASNIQGQLYSGLTFQKFEKDTVFLNLGTFETKKVPVVADNDISCLLYTSPSPRDA